MSEITKTKESGLARAELLAHEIIAIDHQARRIVTQAAMEIGRRLIEVKELLPHGDFGAWLNDHVGYSERTAQNMMRVFTEFGRTGNPDDYSELEFSKAVALLGARSSDRRELIDSGAADGMSVRELQAEIKRRNDEIAAKQITIDELTAAAEDAEKRAQDNAADALALADARIQMAGQNIELTAAKEHADAVNARLGELTKERDAALSRIKTIEKRADGDKNAARDLQIARAEADKLRAEIDEIKARPAESAIVEKIIERAPQGMEQEIRLKESYRRLGEDMRQVMGAIEEMKCADADGAGKYGAEIAGKLRRIADAIDGGKENG